MYECVYVRARVGCVMHECIWCGVGFSGIAKSNRSEDTSRMIVSDPSYGWPCVSPWNVRRRAAILASAGVTPSDLQTSS